MDYTFFGSLVARLACSQPFLAEGHWLAPFFPLSHWAGVLLPAVLLVVGLSLAATFIGVVMMRSGKKKSAGGGAPAAKGPKAKKDD